MNIAVWFSCGAASAVAAKLTVDKYGGDSRVVILNNPVAEEDADNIRFKHDVAKWIGRPVETLVHKNYPEARAVDVWTDRKYMSGPKGAPCTMILKKQARQAWEENNKMDWNVLGFTAEEQKRHDRFILTERVNVLPVLIDAGLTKQDCMNILIDAGIEPPRIYGMGYPNANCVGCVKASSATYWNHVRNMHPDVFKERAEMSREFGVKLVRQNGERVFLDELDPKAKGRPMKTMDVDCGTFCEETA